MKQLLFQSTTPLAEVELCKSAIVTYAYACNPGAP